MDDGMTLGAMCDQRRRPAELLDPVATVAGLRTAQSTLLDGARFCDVWLYLDYPNPPPELAEAARWTLLGPPGTRPVRVIQAEVVPAQPPPGLSQHVHLHLRGQPDIAPYRLEFNPPATFPFDPLRTWLSVRLRPECPDLGSCFDAADPGPAPTASPVHDYLARDWRSLTAALLEFLSTQVPGPDLSPAEPTVALAELFAHAGDLLHYRLDRVATEAYLETARRRTSVHRHARLVDYHFHDGLSARTFIHLTVAPGSAMGPTCRPGDVAADVPGSPIAFTLERGIPPSRARTGLGEIAIYDWGEGGCRLPAGATGCVLVRPQPCDPLMDAWLAPGDLVVFEVVDPGDAGAHAAWAGRDPAQPWPSGGPIGSTTPWSFRSPLASRTAQVVTLTAVTPLADPLARAALQGSLYQVRWGPEDALGEAVPVGIDVTGGIDEVTVVRGNIVPAHHGRVADGPAGTALTPCPDPPADGEAPPSWWLTAAGTPDGGGLGLAFAGAGLPHRLEVTVGLPSDAGTDVEVVPTLLEAATGTLAAVVEVETGEPPRLRFRTGALGMAPPEGSTITARYEVGSGSVGNVPANSLAVLETDMTSGAAGLMPMFVQVPGVAARNPVTASGGEDPVALDVVRREAPQAFAAQPLRAVLDSDLAAVAARDLVVRRAVARRSWSGSWPLVTTVVDLTLDSDAPQATGALRSLKDQLDGLRMLGTEVALVTGTAVGLFMKLAVMVAPGIDPEAVQGRVLGVLQPGTDARPGFFHHSRLSLGSSVYTSAAVAAAAGVVGVDAVVVTEARRLSDPPGTFRDVLRFAANEVPVLDDDPQRPDRGRLEIMVTDSGAQGAQP